VKSPYETRANAIISRQDCVSFSPETCHDEAMPTTRQLRDLYRFPGFVPRATLHGIFGDSWAVVLSLQRRGKKQSAAAAGKYRRPITISDRAGYAISPVAIGASISTSSFAASSAAGVAP
jgi:hypothetical protein